MITKFKLFEQNKLFLLQGIFYKVRDNEVTIDDLKKTSGFIDDFIYDGETILHHLIIQEYDAIYIKTALECGANINQEVYESNSHNITYGTEYISPVGMTPLILASTRGITYATIRLLIDNGADVTKQDTYGKTFIYYLYNGEEWLKENYSEKYEILKKSISVSDFNL